MIVKLRLLQFTRHAHVGIDTTILVWSIEIMDL